MKKLKLFSLLMLLFVGITSVWADKITDYKNIVSGQKYYIGATLSNSTDYYFKANGGTDVITTGVFGTCASSTEDATPVIITISGTTGTIQFESGNYLHLPSTSTPNGKYLSSASSQSWTFSNESGKIRLVNNGRALQRNSTAGTDRFGSYGSTQTDVWLEPAAAPTPSLSIVPTSYDFGDVKDKAAASHDFTISGENLEEGTLNISVTGGYTITSGAITVDANGDLSSNTITVAKNTTTSGSNGGTLKVYGAGVAEADAATATLSMNVKATFVVAVALSVKDRTDATVAPADIPAGIGATINGAASYDVDADGEMDIPLAATTISGWNFVGWTVSDNENLAVDKASNLTTTLTATATGTVTANFKEQSCTPLATPAGVEVSGTAYPFNSVAISWTAVTNADKYDVTIKQGEDVVESASDVVTNSYSLTKTLVVNTTYSYEIVAKSNTPATHCDSDPASANFVTGDYPAATLTLSENGATRTWGLGLKLNSEIALPTAVAAGNEIAGKVLVGWSADADRATAPELAKGANYTMNATAVTLYAVYATETPGTSSLTKQGSSATFSAGDNIVIVAVSGDDKYALYQETKGTSYVKNWTFDNTAATVAADAKKYVTLIAVPQKTTFYLGDATNGYLYNNSSNNLAISTTDSTEWAIAWNSTNSAFTVIGNSRWLSCRTDAANDNANMYRMGGATSGSENGICYLDIYKYDAGTPSYSDYTTTGAKAPTATVDPEEVEISAAAVVGGLIDVTYANVDATKVAVALFDDEACETAFTGEWLSVSLDANKDIVYGAAANTSYVNARTAYIQLTAPSPADGVDPAVVVIPVTQAKKDAVFASFEELVGAGYSTSQVVDVTVTFTNVEITDFTNSRKNVSLDVQAAEKDIQIYNASGACPETWVATGTLSGTALTGKWQYYSTNSVWQFLPTNGWTNFSYAAPGTVGVDNVETSAKAVKVLKNGLLLIEKNGKTYNAQGQVVK